MLARLKSLPLTILLTVLIWMYAEAEFSTTQEGVPVRIQFQSADPNRFVIRAVDDAGAHRVIDVTLTLQGGKDRIERLFPSRAGGSDVVTTIIVTRDPNAISSDASGTTVSLAQTLSDLPFFHDKGIVVVNATPDRVRLQKQKVEAPASQP